MNGLIAATVLVFLILAAIWSRNTVHDFALKVLFWIMTCAWAFEMFKVSGYIVKVSK